MTSPRVRALLRQAERTAESGKRAAAEQLYRQIVEEEPQTIEAWLGLARVSGNESERQTALQRALSLDPDNDEVRELQETRDLRHDGAGSREPNDEGSRPETREAEDPFSQSRSWLDEATARPGADNGTERKSSAQKAEPAAPERPREVARPMEGDVRDNRTATQTAEAGGAADVEAVLYCYRHPQRQTGLRCITCDRPICTQCAKHTPVGYRCPQCIREAQEVFFSAGVLDYVLIGLVTLVLAVIAGLIAPRLGFFVIFIGPAVGTLIGRIAFRVGRRRHGRYLPQLVGALVAIGGLLPSALGMLVGGFSLFGLLWPLVYVFLATGAAYYQVK